MLAVAIVGVESTGKSTLAEDLAKYYDTEWVEEFARKYLERAGQHYSYDDILHIAQKQHQLITETIQTHTEKTLIIIDTELLVTKIWEEYVFGKCHSWIENTLPQQTYQLYLLTDIDLPWEPDPLREYPELEKRQEIHQLYLFHLEKYGFNFHLVSGNRQERLQKAIEIIENYQQAHK
jgi:NadR type nicotinamide-nucleotide adenylyltransferase